jgi:hypothetical protein
MFLQMLEANVGINGVMVRKGRVFYEDWLQPVVVSGLLARGLIKRISEAEAHEILEENPHLLVEQSGKPPEVIPVSEPEPEEDSGNWEQAETMVQSTVAVLESLLAAVDDLGLLDLVMEAETAGKNRQSAVIAIESRIDELSEE